MPVEVGKRLGAYEIGQLAGRGGMGEVYRARDSVLKRTVAIKILPSEFAHDSERVRRLQQEAEALAALNHSNIAGIHALEECDGIRFLVLEFVEGETLAEHLRRGALPQNQVLAIGQQICAALAAAHDRGIVHRDLKPANIKIGPDGQVKLLDFGLARTFVPDADPVDHSHSPTLTAPSAGHVIAGTAAYMAPEQARGRAVDKRADIWALGCVLYEIVTGRPAFAGETVTDILAAVVTHDPPLDALPSALSPQLRFLIGRCLQKDPAARFRDAADAGAVLGAAVEPAMASQSPRRWWAPAIAGGAVVAIAAAIAIPYVRPIAPRPAVVRFDLSVSGAPIAQPMAVSPDGRRLVYVAADGANRNALWHRSLDGLDAKMIEGTESSVRTLMWPAWSRDSRAIAFVADGKLKRIDADGGGAETLASVDSQIGGIDWNRDGTVLFASNNHGLRRVPASGGSVVSVTERAVSLEETYHDCPVFLPDGRHFLYLAYSETKPENRALYAGALDEAKRTRLMASDSCATFAAPGFVLYSRGTKLMARPFDAAGLRFTGDAVSIVDDVATYSNGEQAAFAVSDGGTLMYRKSAPEANRSIIWIDRSGKISDPIGAPIQPGAGPGVHLSPDNKRVAFATRVDGGRDDIWTYDFERNVRLRLTTDPDVDHIPIWSPDGSRLIFDSHRGGKGSSLYEIAANGAVPERVLLKIEGNDFIAASDSSRDGHYLVFHRSPTGGPPWSLWVLPLAGDRMPFTYKSSVADTIGAALSPNGRWLAYSTNESGTYQVVVQPFPDPSGGKWQVSSNGGSFPVWRRDGREIYYVAPSGDLLAVSVTADSTFAVGKSSPLFRMPIDLAAQGSPYDVSADGTRFLVLMPTLKSAPPITTVLNWPAQLKPN